MSPVTGLLNQLTEDQMKVFTVFQYRLYEIRDRSQTKLLKLIIDDSQNPTEEKGYLRSAVDSEFYQKINSQEVAGAIISFRAHYQI